MGSRKERGQEALTWTPSPAALAKKFVHPKSLQSLSSDCPAWVRWERSAGRCQESHMAQGCPLSLPPRTAPFLPGEPQMGPDPIQAQMAQQAIGQASPQGCRPPQESRQEPKLGLFQGLGVGGQSTAHPVCCPLPKATVTESPPREKQQKGTRGRG